MNNSWLSEYPIYFTAPDGSQRTLSKDSPSPPPAPDYTGAAQATATGNIAAAQAATRANRVNQYTPYGSSEYSQGDPHDPNSQWSQYINLTPTGQSLLNSANQSQLGIAGLQQGATQAVQNTMGQPFDASGIPRVQTSVNQTPLQTSVGDLPGVQRNVAQPGVQSQINTTGVAGIPQVNEQARQAASDAAYNQATSRLDPQFNTQQQQLETRLTNQGLTPGTEAYDNAMRDFNFARNDAYSGARNQAVQQGLANQQAQFGMGLSANQTGFGEAQNQGQFANQAAGQQFGMGLQNAGLFNQGGAQQFGQQLQAGQFGNQAEGQMFNQGLAGAQFGNQAGGMALDRNLALYNQPLNQLNALRSSSQVTNPQFGNVPQQQTTAGPNYSQAAQQTGQYDQNLYNQQVGQQNAMTGGLFSLGAAAVGAPWMPRPG